MFLTARRKNFKKMQHRWTGMTTYIYQLQPAWFTEIWKCFPSAPCGSIFSISISPSSAGGVSCLVGVLRNSLLMSCSTFPMLLLLWYNAWKVIEAAIVNRRCNLNPFSSWKWYHIVPFMYPDSLFNTWFCEKVHPWLQNCIFYDSCPGWGRNFYIWWYINNWTCQSSI